jgi:hypothetical protein
MKTTKILLSLGTIVLAGGLLFTSCRKKEKSEPKEQDNDYSTASDNSLAETAANDAMSMGSQLSENSGVLTTYKSLPGAPNVFLPENIMFASACTSITPGPGLVPSSYTINFGTSGCLGTDGRVRKGKLIYDFSQSAVGADRYRKPGFKMTITSQSYEVDGNGIVLTKTVTNTTPNSIPQGTNPGTNITWAISANATVSKSGGGTITWVCNRTKELTNTNDANCYKGQTQAIDWTKAIVKLNGTASGTNAGNETYSAVAHDLVRDFNCAPNGLTPHRHPFISGTVVYTPGSKATRTINYGSGTCDFNATVEVNGNTYTLSIQ